MALLSSVVKRVVLGCSVFLLFITDSLPGPSPSWAGVPLKGDLTGDGKVDTRDSVVILRMLAGQTKPTPAQKIMADVSPPPTGDGKLALDDLVTSLGLSVGKGNFQPLHIKILAIARKYHDICSNRIEVNLKDDFLTLTALSPKTFDGNGQDEKRAARLANIAAGAALAADSRFFAAALASVALADGLNKNVAAHNLAEAINMLAMVKNSGLDAAELRNDAVAVYLYAAFLDPRNVDTLVNLGNVYIDLDRLEDAREMFEAAMTQIPGYVRAREGMAAYWLAKGDEAKAAEMLKDDQMLLPGVVGKIQRAQRELDDPAKAPEVSPDASLEDAKAAIDKLNQLKIVSTADVIEEIDPVDAQQIRNKINSLPASEQLVLPRITSIAMVNSYEKYYWDADGFVGFQEELQAFFEPWAERVDLLQQKINASIDFNEDALEQLEQAMESGNFDSFLRLLAQFDPRMANSIATEAGPIRHYIQYYNTRLYMKKFVAYLMYFRKLNEKYRMMVMDDMDLALGKIDDLWATEEFKIGQIMDSSLAPEIKEVKIKEIKIQYGLFRNRERENSFHRSFDTMVYQYINVFKPMMEKMWVDCMPHVNLVDSQVLRDMWYHNIALMAVSESSDFLGLVMTSAGVDGMWDDVTYEGLRQVDEELARIYRERAALEFMAAKAPSGQGGEFLDRFYISQSWGPIDVKISPTSISISGTALIAASLSYNWRTDMVEGGVGVGIKLSAQAEGIGASGELSTMLTYKMNLTSGQVTELDWKGTAGLSGSVANVTIGGNYEASVLNGNKFSPAVSVVYENMNVDAVK